MSRVAHVLQGVYGGGMTYTIIPTDASGMAATADAYTVPNLATAYAMMDVPGRTIDGTYAHDGRTVFARVFDTAWLRKHEPCACNACVFVANNPATFK